MAALTGITAVKPTPTTRTQQGKYGGTISFGSAVYKDSADNKWKPADANGASAAIAAIVGVAITPGVDGDTGIIAVSGSIILVGVTMVVGKAYYVGQTPGVLVEESDLTTGDYVSKAGTSATTTEMLLGIEATGITHS